MISSQLLPLIPRFVAAGKKYGQGELMPKFTDKFIATLKDDSRYTSDTLGFQIKVEKNRKYFVYRYKQNNKMDILFLWAKQLNDSLLAQYPDKYCHELITETQLLHYSVFYDFIFLHLLTIPLAFIFTFTKEPSVSNLMQLFGICNVSNCEGTSFEGKKCLFYYSTFLKLHPVNNLAQRTFLKFFLNVFLCISLSAEHAKTQLSLVFFNFKIILFNHVFRSASLILIPDFILILQR